VPLGVLGATEATRVYPGDGGVFSAWEVEGVAVLKSYIGGLGSGIGTLWLGISEAVNHICKP
jgi:hypothetical protein